MFDRKYIPKLKTQVDYEALPLGAEEGFLLSRIDGETSVEELVLLTGFGEERVQGVLDCLAQEGVLELEASPGLKCSVSDNGVEVSEKSLRSLFMREFACLDVDARIKKAKTLDDRVLKALCFDPDPRVIKAILDNTRVGLDHARMIAAHHISATGLGHLGRKAALIRDTEVQRKLFRNPQLSDSLFNKLMNHKRMSYAYNLALSRDIAERVKTNSRKVFRKKFGSGTSEEKVSLILKTEGRCLSMLIGVPLDGKSAALLTKRPVHSVLLAQNLARWPATPPSVLAHLARQNVVRRSQSLRDLVQRHPNSPSKL